MLIKPLRNKGKGSPKAVLRYLLDKPDGQVRILKGDPTLSQRIAESLSYQQTYEAWVLSFEEKELSDNVKMAIIAEFEQSFLPYFQDDPTRYNTAWIEHSDKGRVELNLFMPKVDLRTEKQISLFNKSRSADWELANNFRDYINDRFQLSNPLDPSKAKLVKSSDWVLKADSYSGRKTKEIVESISDSISKMVEFGSIQNRDDIIKALNEANFNITRISKTSISIQNPANPGGQNIKLKGVLFDESFRTLESASEVINTRASRNVRAEYGSHYQQDRGRSNVHRNEIREPYSDFRARLDESIEQRRKTQQRAFNEESGTGRAFKRSQSVVGINPTEPRHAEIEYNRNATVRKGYEHSDHGNEKEFSRRGSEIEIYESEFEPNRSRVKQNKRAISANNGTFDSHFNRGDSDVYRSARGVGIHSDLFKEIADDFSNDLRAVIEYRSGAGGNFDCLREDLEGVAERARKYRDLHNQSGQSGNGSKQLSGGVKFDKGIVEQALKSMADKQAIGRIYSAVSELSSVIAGISQRIKTAISDVIERNRELAAVKAYNNLSMLLKVAEYSKENRTTTPLRTLLAQYDKFIVSYNKTANQLKPEHLFELNQRANTVGNYIRDNKHLLSLSGMGMRR